MRRLRFREGFIDESALFVAMIKKLKFARLEKVSRKLPLGNFLSETFSENDSYSFERIRVQNVFS